MVGKFPVEQFILGVEDKEDQIEAAEKKPHSLLDMMAQRLARRAEDREVPGSSPTRD